ncbi:MAG: hypothetical protein GIKADHBN_00240 [Phycisphaerales bacterium]|nr:hypothetical protein [Phycisphaerales bacterium]
MNHTRTIAIALGLLGGLASTALGQMEFHAIQPPDHPVYGVLRYTNTALFGSVSADGNTVVGTAWRGFGAPSITYRWRRGLGVEAIPQIPGDPGQNTSAIGVSSDGQTIAMDKGQTGVGYYAYRDGTYEYIGLQTEVRAISAPDGTWMGGVESGSLTAHRWSAATGVQDIGGLPGADETDAEDISHDGNVVVGRSFGGVEQAFIWTTDEGMTNLGAVIGATRSGAIQVASDGATVLLTATIPGESARSFLWDRSSSELTPLANFEAIGANADFSILNSYTSIWTESTGALNVLDLLRSSGALPEGFSVDLITGISAGSDPLGLVSVAGNGRDEIGNERAWVATFSIPCPSTSVLIGVLGVHAAVRRRRGRPA